MGIRDFFRKKRSRSGADDGGVTRHCFVLCREAQPGGLSRATEVVARIFGPEYSAETDDGNSVVVKRGEASVGLLLHMSIPIPDGEAENCADRNIFWSGGKEEAARHRSHVVVASMHTEEPTPTESALMVSRLALVALDVFDGIGVYWGNAGVCNSREVFELFCRRMSEDHLPLPVWLRFDFVRASDDAIGVYTTGMSQFGLMEIEVDRCTMAPNDLCEFVSDLAHYLVQSGPVIKDGNTVGPSDEQRILVRHRPSMIDDDRMVYKLVFDESP